MKLHPHHCQQVYTNVTTTVIFLQRFKNAKYAFATKVIRSQHLLGGVHLLFKIRCSAAISSEIKSHCRNQKHTRDMGKEQPFCQVSLIPDQQTTHILCTQQRTCDGVIGPDRTSPPFIKFIVSVKRGNIDQKANKPVLRFVRPWFKC